jgi:hypothetical protein
MNHTKALMEVSKLTSENVGAGIAAVLCLRRPHGPRLRKNVATIEFKVFR